MKLLLASAFMATTCLAFGTTEEAMTHNTNDNFNMHDGPYEHCVDLVSMHKQGIGYKVEFAVRGDEVAIRMSAPVEGNDADWLGIGMSAGGQVHGQMMNHGQFVMGSTDGVYDYLNLEDRQGKPATQGSSGYSVASFAVDDGTATLTFTRPLTINEPGYQSIPTSGPFTLLWASGLTDGSGYEALQYHNNYRGHPMIDLSAVNVCGAPAAPAAGGPGGHGGHGGHGH